MSIVPTNINNYLRQFAYQLEERILQQFPPLLQPGEPLPAELARLRRTPYPAQALAIAGIAKRWEAARDVKEITRLGQRILLEGLVAFQSGFRQGFQNAESRYVSDLETKLVEDLA